MTDYGRRWAVILAGGDGTRLRPLTRELAGDDRPKQYCRVLGDETLLEQTRQRVSRSVSPLRTLVVVTRHHERFYRDALADLPPHAVVVQPENRGTAAGILCPLLRLETLTASDVVALFPSDHYVSDDETFMAHVDAAFDAVRACPDLTVLLGVRPDRPETEYGWIEPGHPVVPLARPWPILVSGVRRFWEKPRPKVAAALRARGCLWNSFLIVARVSALVGLVRQALPAVYGTLASARPAFDGPREDAAVRDAYAFLPSADFSREVLAVRPERLGVLPVSGVTWNDLGDPARVFATRRQVEHWRASRARWPLASRIHAGFVDGKLPPILRGAARRGSDRQARRDRPRAGRGARSLEADMTQRLTCRDVIDLLVDYLEQSLPPETLEGFDRHLDQCPACVAYINTYRKTRELTGEVTRVAMPEDMRTRLRQFLLDRLGRPPA